MIQEKETLVHWYYSVAEWEAFMRIENKKHQAIILLQLLFVWALGLLIIRFVRHGWWIQAIAISGGIALAFGAARYYFHLWTVKWKGKRMPEVLITDFMATVNEKPVIFRGKDHMLRKVDIKEYGAINILEICFERQTVNGMTFDELRIPVPKGKLREAIEVQVCLNLRRDVLSLFL